MFNNQKYEVMRLTCCLFEDMQTALERYVGLHANSILTVVVARSIFQEDES